MYMGIKSIIFFRCIVASLTIVKIKFVKPRV